LSCVPHASTGVLNMSDASAHAAVSFIITLPGKHGVGLTRDEARRLAAHIAKRPKRPIRKP
jgi:hypothetical protein